MVWIQFFLSDYSMEYLIMEIPIIGNNMLLISISMEKFTIELNQFLTLKMEEILQMIIFHLILVKGKKSKVKLKN